MHMDIGDKAYGAIVWYHPTIFGEVGTDCDM